MLVRIAARIERQDGSLEGPTEYLLHLLVGEGNRVGFHAVCSVGVFNERWNIVRRDSVMAQGRNSQMSAQMFHPGDTLRGARVITAREEASQFVVAPQRFASGGSSVQGDEIGLHDVGQERGAH